MITHLVAPGHFPTEEIEITGAAYRHLFRARRLATGARLRLVDGQGNARWGTVATIDRQRAVVRTQEAAPSHEPPYELALWVAALRRERATYLVEKATEIGVAAIRFLVTDRTPRKYGTGSVERLRRVAVAALEQSHRARLPEISGPHSLAELFASCGDRDDRWVLDPSGRGAQLCRSGPGAGVVAVGPEGGWSAGELATMASQRFQAVGFGPRILRVETAAVAAVAGCLLPAP